MMDRRAQSLRAARRFSEAAGQWRRMLREHPNCVPTPESQSRVLNAVAVSHSEAGELRQAIQVWEILANQFLVQNNGYSIRALHHLAESYRSIRTFSLSAQYYEQFAQYVHEHPTEAQQADSQAVAHAMEGLKQATLFRIGLIDSHEPASRQRPFDNVQHFREWFGNNSSARIRETAIIEFGLGRIYQNEAEQLQAEIDRINQRAEQLLAESRSLQGTANAATRQRVLAERTQLLSQVQDRQSQARERWQSVVRHYTQWMNRYSQNGTLDLRIQGAAALGRGLWMMGRTSDARPYFQQVDQWWGRAVNNQANRTTGEQTILNQLGDSDGPAAVERTIEFVAESRFRLAEMAYQTFVRRQLPRFTGHTQSAYHRWEQSALQPFIRAQMTAFRNQAEPLYRTVMDMHVPEWQLAAAARLADMYYQFAQDIREAPMPPAVQSNDELRGAYVQVLEEQTTPLEQLSITGYEGCIRVATQIHWFSEWSSLCERNLHSIAGARYPLADEARSTASFVYSRAASSRAVRTLPTHSEEQ